MEMPKPERFTLKGSAPASGAAGRALAARTGAQNSKPIGVLRADGFGARARRTAAGAAALPSHPTTLFRLRRWRDYRTILQNRDNWVLWFIEHMDNQISAVSRV